MSGRIFIQYNSSRPWGINMRSLVPYLDRQSKKYNHVYQNDIDVDVKAPSTEDEFKRVAEEKKKAQEALASETSEKASEAVEEAVASNGDIERVKKKSEQHEPVADCRQHRRGCN